MYNIKTKSDIEPRLLSAQDACAYLGMGRTNGTRLLKEIGSEVRYRKRCLYDRKVIDSYLDSLNK